MAIHWKILWFYCTGSVFFGVYIAASMNCSAYHPPSANEFTTISILDISNIHFSKAHSRHEMCQYFTYAARWNAQNVNKIYKKIKNRKDIRYTNFNSTIFRVFSLILPPGNKQFRCKAASFTWKCKNFELRWKSASGCRKNWNLWFITAGVIIKWIIKYPARFIIAEASV